VNEKAACRACRPRLTCPQLSFISWPVRPTQSRPTAYAETAAVADVLVLTGRRRRPDLDGAEIPDALSRGVPIMVEPAADVGAADVSPLRSWVVGHPIATFLVLVYATTTALVFVPKG
jgi:hypothetical protein